ncbi:hypothetical protein H0E87_014974 [Populus deltoides]|uniref:Uncharacterized protein n=1 Tax=Populus deltoides TaxID=3696 RepID=A0A8T2YFH4_POPDE|nr:hypothetical protein H0E87_014974 [Populus deltoides]
METKRAYLVQGRSWCSGIYFQAQPGYWLKPVTDSGAGIKLVGGVDRYETTGLIAGLLLWLIPVPMEEKQKLHRLRRRNWRRNEGTQTMVKACWLVSLCFQIVAAVVGLGGGWSGAMSTERAASGAGEEMAGGAVVGQEREDEREDSNN